MATSLLTPTQAASFVALAEKHLPTFQTVITVHKQPTETVTSNAVNVYPGYKEKSTETNISYTPVSQSFSGLITKMSNKTPQELWEINKRIWQGDARIKVQQDARDYILNGKTIKVVADQKNWDIISGPSTQTFLSLEYFYFDLKEIH